MDKNVENDKLDWMYRGANNHVDREEYLLGKSVDKNFEQLNNEEKEKKLGLLPPKNHVEHECIPPSIRDFNKIVKEEQVDLSAKLQEDPLVAIKKQEEEARRQFLQNPIQLKKLQDALQAQEKKKHKKKKKKKHSDSDDDLDKQLTEKLKYLKGNYSATNLIKKGNKKSKEDHLDTILMHKFNQLKDKLSKKDMDDILAGRSSDSDDEYSNNDKNKENHTSESDEEISKNKQTNNDSGDYKTSKYKSSNKDIEKTSKGKTSDYYFSKKKTKRKHSDDEAPKKKGRSVSSDSSDYLHKDSKKELSKSRSDRKHKSSKERSIPSDRIRKRSKERSMSVDRKQLSKSRTGRRVKSSKERTLSSDSSSTEDFYNKDKRKLSKSRTSKSERSTNSDKKHKSLKERSTSSDSSNNSRHDRYKDKKKLLNSRTGRSETHVNNSDMKSSKERRKYRDSSSESEYERKNRKEKYGKRKEQSTNVSKDRNKEDHKKKKNYQSSSSDSDSENKSNNKKVKDDNLDKMILEKLRMIRNSNPDRDDKSEKTLQTFSHYDSDNDEYVLKKKSFGLVKSDGTKIPLKNPIGDNKKAISKKTEVSKTTDIKKNQHKKLSDKEKEELRKQMMVDAVKRDKERSDNLKKHRLENTCEESKIESFDKNFIHRELSKGQNNLTDVESRLKSKLNNIQRSSQHMNSNFSKRS